MSKSSAITVGERRFLSVVVVVGSATKDDAPGHEVVDEALQRAIVRYSGGLDR